jgi:D-serine deaminase-like pyridoxal phosphate-dependent protein
MIERESYEISRPERFLTPALLIYPELVRHNVRTTVELLGGDATRFRPHIKTAKLASMVREMVQLGVKEFKCATTLELLTACSAGASAVLVAYPVGGPAARRVREIARSFPAVAISVLVESREMLGEWAGSGIGVFIDVNPGMDRTGIAQEAADGVVDLARAIGKAGIEFRGIHYYDGHLHSLPLDERTAASHRGYDQLLGLVATLEAAGISVERVITAGTPAFPCSLSYEKFRTARFHHQVSPGTLIYNDLASLGSLPGEWDYRPAALVLTRVVSRPKPNIITCDAGHKTVSVDAGVPNCQVLGRGDLVPRRPNEEHLPIEVPEGAPVPALGDLLYLLPKHICPTVNNFDHALIVEQGKVTRVDRVTARGRENPLLAAAKAGPIT